MRKTVVSFGGFILAVALVFWLVVFLGRVSEVKVAGQGGVADLTAVAFARVTAQVNGWERTPGVLLAPGETKEMLGKHTDEKATFGTYTLRMKLPDAKMYIVGFNSLEFSTKVFVNGREIDEIGRVSESEVGFVASKDYRHYVVQPENGQIDILLQYANFYTDVVKIPRLYVGLPDQMFSRQVHADFTRFTLMAVYFAAFILYFGMYMFNRRASEQLWFSVTCLLLAMRESFVGEQFVSSLLAGVPMDWIFILQYVTIGLLVILLFAFIFSLYPDIMPKKNARLFYVACGAFVLVSFFTRSYVPKLQLYGFLAIGALVMGYILVYIFLNFKKMAVNRRLSGVGIVVLFVALFNDMFHLLNKQIGPVGSRALLQRVMIVFIFIQMVALFLQFVSVERQLGETRKEQAVLAAQNETLQMVDRQRMQFLSHVSHELKTPLTVVSSYAQLTRQREQNSSECDEYVVQKMLLVASEAERMAMMVEQVLDIARIEEGRMNYHFEPADVKSLIRGIVEVYYPVLNKNHNTLRLEIAPDLPPILIDKMRIQQGIVNLVNNALRFTKKGIITISARQTAQLLELKVSDTGTGMEKEQLEHLFERYNTSGAMENQRAGTGLGLYITREIVQAHGGEISVLSTPRVGTQVTVLLPYRAQEDADER